MLKRTWLSQRQDNQDPRRCVLRALVELEVRLCRDRLVRVLAEVEEAAAVLQGEAR